MIKKILKKIYEPVKWFGGQIKEQIKKDIEFKREMGKPSEEILDWFRWKKFFERKK